MSVRQEQPQQLAGAILPIGDPGAAPTESLGEGNSFAVATPDHPLKRIVAVSIKASLNELCLQKARGTWAPSQEALRNIFQQVSRRPQAALARTEANPPLLPRLLPTRPNPCSAGPPS